MRACRPLRTRRHRHRLRRPSAVTLRMIAPRGGADDGASPRTVDSTVTFRRAIWLPARGDPEAARVLPWGRSLLAPMTAQPQRIIRWIAHPSRRPAPLTNVADQRDGSAMTQNI